MRLQRGAVPAVLTALTLGAGFVGSSAASIGAGLRVRSLEPVSVQGIRFEPSERVRVTLDGIWLKHVRANANGSFVVTYRLHSANRCDGYIVKAVGSKGSRATLGAPPLECASINPG